MNSNSILIDNKAVYTVGWRDFTTIQISNMRLPYSIDKSGVKWNTTVNSNSILIDNKAVYTVGWRDFTTIQISNIKLS